MQNSYCDHRNFDSVTRLYPFILNGSSIKLIVLSSNHPQHSQSLQHDICHYINAYTRCYHTFESFKVTPNDILMLILFIKLRNCKISYYCFEWDFLCCSIISENIESIETLCGTARNDKIAKYIIVGRADELFLSV